MGPASNRSSVQHPFQCQFIQLKEYPLSPNTNDLRIAVSAITTLSACQAGVAMLNQYPSTPNPTMAFLASQHSCYFD